MAVLQDWECLLGARSHDHCIRGCSWAAPSGVEFAVGDVRILDNRRKLVAEFGQVD